MFLNKTAKHLVLEQKKWPADPYGHKDRPQPWWRKVVRHKLDLNHCPNRKRGDKWAILTIPEMQSICAQRLTHMKGHAKLLQWVADAGHCATPKVGVAFWHDGKASNATRKQMLPDSFETGMKSAVRVSGLQVTLLAYAPIGNVPRGVHVSARSKYCNSDGKGSKV